MNKRQKHLTGGLLALLMAASVPMAAMAEGRTTLNPVTNNTSSYNRPANVGTFSAPSTNNAIQNQYGYGGNEDSPSLRGRISAIPKGTNLLVKLDQPVSSFTNKVGDPVTATLESDIFINDSVAVPAGSEVVGQVTTVNPASRMGHHGDIEVRFFSLKTPTGEVVPLKAHVITTDQSGVLKGNTFTQDLVKSVGVTALSTGAGAVIGTSAGALMGAAGGGAVLGTFVGLGGGTAYALMRKGKDVVMPVGARLSLTTSESSNVTP
jgi:hypothetical protein